MMDRCFILGGDSFIGNALAIKLRHLHYHVTTSTRRAELADASSIHVDLALPLPQFHPFNTSFLCAGITNMSVCEAEPERTYAINVTATVAAAKALLALGSRVMFISSNTVFDGSIENPAEATHYCSANEYGRQKAETERQLLALGAGVVIIRITKVIAPMNVVFRNIITKLQASESIELFDDLYISPISAAYLTDGIIKIAASGIDGIFHLSGEKDVSYAGFAAELARMLHVSPALIQCKPASGVLFKPQFASLGMERTTQLLSIQPESCRSVLSTLT